MLMIAEFCCIMGGVGPNLVVEEVFERGERRDCGSNKAGIIQGKAGLFLEQDSISMMYFLQ